MSLQTLTIHAMQMCKDRELNTQSHAWRSSVITYIYTVAPKGWYVRASVGSTSLYQKTQLLPVFKIEFNPLVVRIERGTRHKPETQIVRCRSKEQVLNLLDAFIVECKKEEQHRDKSYQSQPHQSIQG